MARRMACDTPGRGEFFGQWEVKTDAYPAASIGRLLSNGAECVHHFEHTALELQKNKKMAERVGFEPTVGINLHTLSKRAP